LKSSTKSMTAALPPALISSPAQASRRLEHAEQLDHAADQQSLLVELLDHDLIEERPQLVPHRLGRIGSLRSAHLPNLG
jgi:hypothetical protein